jgi:hypothetical protein
MRASIRTVILALTSRNYEPNAKSWAQGCIVSPAPDASPIPTSHCPPSLRIPPLNECRPTVRRPMTTRNSSP